MKEARLMKQVSKRSNRNHQKTTGGNASAKNEKVRLSHRPKQPSKSSKAALTKSKVARKRKLSGSLAYHIYLESLSESGRKAVSSLLNTVTREMGYKRGAQHYPWHKIRYETMHHIRSRLIARNYSTASCNLGISSVRGVCKAAFNLGQLDAEQLMRIQSVPKVRGDASMVVGRSITKGELDAMIKVCDREKEVSKGKRNKALLMVGCYGGLRCNEIRCLNITDFNAKQGILQVLSGKGGKQRTVYLAKPAIDALTAWIEVLNEGEGALFRGIKKNGDLKNSITNEGIAKILQYLQKQTGIPKLTRCGKWRDIQVSQRRPDMTAVMTKH